MFGVDCWFEIPGGSTGPMNSWHHQCSNRISVGQADHVYDVAVTCLHKVVRWCPSSYLQWLGIMFFFWLYGVSWVMGIFEIIHVIFGCSMFHMGVPPFVEPPKKVTTLVTRWQPVQSPRSDGTKSNVIVGEISYNYPTLGCWGSKFLLPSGKLT